MLGLGWTEMLVLGIVALVVIGPKDLPVVMNRIGKLAGQIRRMGTEFQREINRSTGLDEVRNLRNSIAAPLKKTTEEIRREFNTMTPTGPKPSGALKPSDPNVESVVDEIKARANMPVAKSADERAAEYGFKPSTTPKTSEPAADVEIAATEPAPKRKAPLKAKAAPTRPVLTMDLPPVAAQAEGTPSPAQSEPAAPRKRAARKAAPATADVGGAEPVATERTTRKPAADAAAAPAQSEPAAPKRRRAVKAPDGAAE